jgi:cytochrome b6-f complex iron-sulfur subunit
MSPEQPLTVSPSETKGPELKKRVKPEEIEGSLYSRRDFFIKAGWYFFWVIMTSWVLGLVRYMFPRVLFEPSNIFKAGFPTEYPVGEISTRWVAEQRVWIARTPEGFYALRALCTHLGCTPIWLASESKFKCPCHGSGFHRDGVNFEGPAPRALERAKITLAEDGQILIDKGTLFLFEKGEWNKPEAFLSI